MWDKIKSELAALFSSQNSSIVTGVKSAVLDELNSLKAELGKANADLATAKSALAEKVSALEKSAQEVADAKASVEKLTNDLEAAKKIAPAQAQQITAAQGQPPIHTAPPATVTGTTQSAIKRADFEAMSVSERSKFIRTGGKITD
jgi:chromosome segregation ATPase